MDPIAFSIFGLDIRWYGILIASGMVLGALLALAESRRVGFNENYILDIILVSVPSAIVGARLYYVIFEWNNYKNNLLEIFALRQGGLAIHGGVIAAVIAAAIYTTVRRVDFLKAADICAPSIILGQAIGRWGNFFNQEAYGGPVSREFISRFPEFIQRQMFIEGAYHHPTFLYEFLWNIIVFTILILYRRKNKVDGIVFFMYIALYSVGRFFIEGMRTDSLMMGNLRTAQVISVILILGSLISIFFLKMRGRKKNY